MLHEIYIGRSHFTLSLPYDMEWEEEAAIFTRPNPYSPADSGRLFQVIPVDRVPGIGAPMSASTPIRRIYLDGSQEARELIYPDSGEAYAVYAELDQSSSSIFIDAGKPELFELSTFFYNYLAIDRNLIGDDQIILHSCYIIYKDEAILFTAPSGTGKSTQGDHWAKCFGAEVINGDRSLLAKVDGGWRAFGLPFSGTSGICKNISAPVKAIVYLHQGPENSVKLMDVNKTFRMIYEQITVNQWNVDFVMKAMDLTDQLVQDVPVYEFECTKYAEAAEYLKGVLYPED